LRSGTVVLVFCLVLFGIWLRAGLWDEPLWVDELHTSWCAVGEWSQLCDRAASGNQSPLYFAGQKILGTMLGDWGQGLRWPSLCASGALLAMVILLSERWTKSPLAVVVAAAWVVVDADTVFYSIEARPYAILMLVSTLHAALGFERLRCLLHSQSESKTSSNGPTLGLRGSWVLTAALMIHLHYTALLVLAVEWIVMGLAWLVFRWQTRAATTVDSVGRRVGIGPGLVSLAVDVGLVCLLIAPLTTGLLDVGGRRNTWSEFVSGSWDQVWPFVRLGIGTVVLPSVGLLWGWIWIWLGRRWRGTEVSVICPPRLVVVDPLRCLWFAVVGIGTVLLAAALTYSEVAPVLLVRYLVAVLPLAALCGAMLVGSIAGPWLRLGSAVVCLCFLVSSDRVVQYWWQTGAWPPERIEGWDECVATINESGFENWPVVLYPGLIEERRLSETPDPSLVEYLRFPLQSAYPLEGDSRRLVPASPLSSPVIPAQSLEYLDQTGGLWIVVRDQPNQPVVLWRVLEALNRDLASLDDRFTIDRFQYGAVHLLGVRRLGSKNKPDGPSDGV
jgi:hypothetical protein